MKLTINTFRPNIKLCIRSCGFSLDSVFLFFCFFPFVGPLSGFDNQPIALLFAVLVLCMNTKIKIIDRNFFVGLIILLLIAIPFSFSFFDAFNVVKRLYSYICALIIPMAFYNCNIDICSEKFERQIKNYMLIWFFVGLIQRFINRNFLIFLVSSMRGGWWRGVTGLANEPSFYGYMAFFFFLFSLEFKKNRNLFIAINMVQMFLLSQSTVTLIYVAVFIGLLVLAYLSKFSSKYIARILAFICMGVVGIAFLIHRYSNARIGILIRNILRNPIYVINNDASVNARVGAIIDSFAKFPFPGFMGGTTLMSGYGGVFFDFGLLAVFFILYFFKLMQMGYKGYYKWVIPVTVSICMFSAIQLASPIFGLYMGICVKRCFDSKLHTICQDRK